MYKRFLFGLIVGSILIGGSACYKEVADLEIDPLRPEYVVPALRDQLSVEDLLKRSGEATNIEYDPDGTCVAVFKETRKLAVAGMNPLVSKIPGELTADVAVTGASTEVTFRTIWEILENRNVKEAYFAKNTKEFGIVLWYDHTAPGHTSTSLKGNIEIGGVEKAFELDLMQPKFIDLRQEITDESKHIEMLDGTDYNILKYKLNSLALAGASDPNIRIHAQIRFKDLYLSKAIGHATTTVSATKQKLQFNLDIFSTSSEVNLFLPEGQVRFALERTGTDNLALRVGSAIAKPKDHRQDLVGSPLASGLTIANQGLSALSPEEKKKTLLLNDMENVIDAEKKVFELNKTNSNVNEAFANGLYSLEMNDVYITSSTIIGSVDAELPLNGVVNLVAEVRIPFYGAIKKISSVSDLDVSGDAFPGEYIDALPKEVKDAVILHIGLLNKLPLNGYAQLDFVDKNGVKIFSLNLNKENQLDDKALFFRAGTVNDEGRVTEPAFTEHICPISRQDYEKLSAYARKLVASYVFTTPKADETTPKSVRFLKDDELILQIALEVNTYIEHPLDFADSISKKAKKK